MKNEFDRRNLEAMYDKGFVNFNFIYNCIKYPSSDWYLLRKKMLKKPLPETWF